MPIQFGKTLERQHVFGWFTVVAIFAAALQVGEVVSKWNHTSSGASTAIQVDSDTALQTAPIPTSATDAPLNNGPAPLYWNDGKTTYRAVHFISVWNAKSGQWQRISPDLTVASVMGSDGYGVDGITAVAKVGSTWYAGTLTGGLSVCINGHWSDKSFGLPARTVTALAISPDTPGGTMAAAGFDGYSSATPDHPGHVYITFDSGTTWTDISGNLPDVPVQSLHFTTVQGQVQLLAKMADRWYVMDSRTGQWTAWNGLSSKG